jgi:BMFP domain-containing protein YqiC
MQSQNRLFDDFVKVMNGAAGTIAGMTREAQAAMQERARDWIGGLDLVGREEFEAVKAMAIAAREENEALAARIAALESGGSAKPAGGDRGKRQPGVKA